MERIAITVEDLGVLVQLIGDLARGGNASQRFEPILGALNRLLPFRHCILLHEREGASGPITLRYEYCGFGDGPGRQVFAGTEVASIDQILDCLDKKDERENAFAWDKQHTESAAGATEFGDLHARLNASHGIGGVFRQRDAKAGSGATLILLLHPLVPVVARHLTVVNSVIRPLHSTVLKNAEFNDRSIKISNLTAQEAKVMHWVVEGKTSWEVGKILSISERTVKFHLANIYVKLNVTNRVHAVSMVSKAKTAPRDVERTVRLA